MNSEHSKKDLSQKDCYLILFNTVIEKTDRTVAAYIGYEDHLPVPTLQKNPSKKADTIDTALVSPMGIPQYVYLRLVARFASYPFRVSPEKHNVYGAVVHT